MTSKVSSGSVAAFWSEFVPLTTEANPTSGPKICRSDHDWSFSEGLALFTRMATLGASSSWEVGGLGPRPRSKKKPAVSPAAPSAGAVAASKIREPAGIGPALALVNAASATSRSTPSRSRSSTAWTSWVPFTATAYQSAGPPPRTPPCSGLTASIGSVFGLNPAPSGISTTSAPHSEPWAHAPGGAYSWVIRSEMSWPAARVVYARPRNAWSIQTTYDLLGNVRPCQVRSRSEEHTSELQSPCNL